MYEERNPGWSATEDPMDEQELSPLKEIAICQATLGTFQGGKSHYIAEMTGPKNIFGICAGHPVSQF